MKKFITNNWKNILIAIGGVIAMIVLIYKIAAPKTIIADYVKYGKVIERTEKLDVGEIVLSDENALFNMNNMDPELIKIATIMIIGILAVIILTTITNSASAKKDAKKK